MRIWCLGSGSRGAKPAGVNWKNWFEPAPAWATVAVVARAKAQRVFW